MAFAATTEWDVRTTGNDANGGGFNTAAAGTDYSQQDAPQVAYTDLAIDGTTNTKITSAATPFTAAHVGNIINVTGGTGFTVQRVQIVSVDASNVATCDKAVGTAGSTGGAGNLGGALATPGKATGLAVADNKIHIKSGTYSLSGTANVAGGRLVPAARVRLTGFGTTHEDDGTRPVLQATTGNTSFVGGTTAAATNLVFDGNNVASSSGVYQSIIRDCEVKNYGTYGVAQSRAYCVSSHHNGTHGFEANSVSFACVSHNNSLRGFNGGTTSVACISYGNGQDGFYGGANIVNCVAHDNGMAGFHPTAALDTMYNCISYGNTTYNFNDDNNVVFFVQSCAMGGAGTADYSANAAAKVIAVDSVSLTADPFTDAANGDFSLNSAAGGGALLKAAGFPGAFPGGTTTGYIDIGAAQSQGGGAGDYPAESDVRADVGYGGSPATYTGTLDLPAEADVKSGVTYDNGTKTGTLVASRATAHAFIW